MKLYNNLLIIYLGLWKKLLKILTMMLDYKKLDKEELNMDSKTNIIERLFGRNY